MRSSYFFLLFDKYRKRLNFFSLDEDLEVNGKEPVKSPFDLLADSIPSTIPSPDLQPAQSEHSAAMDLITLDNSPLTLQGHYTLYYYTKCLAN